MSILRKLERSARLPLAAVCGYEMIALATGQMPTVTELCQNHRRLLIPIALAVLAVHLWFPPPPRIRVVITASG